MTSSAAIIVAITAAITVAITIAITVAFTIAWSQLQGDLFPHSPVLATHIHFPAFTSFRFHVSHIPLWTQLEHHPITSQHNAKVTFCRMISNNDGYLDTLQETFLCGLIFWQIGLPTCDPMSSKLHIDRVELDLKECAINKYGDWLQHRCCRKHKQAYSIIQKCKQSNDYLGVFHYVVDCLNLMDI